MFQEDLQRLTALSYLNFPLRFRLNMELLLLFRAHKILRCYDRYKFRFKDSKERGRNWEIQERHDRDLKSKDVMNYKFYNACKIQYD